MKNQVYNLKGEFNMNQFTANIDIFIFSIPVAFP